MKKISSTKNLEELAETLNTLTPEQIEEQGYDGLNYPIFSLLELMDTTEIWSYDDHSVMVLNEEGKYYLDPRCPECGEASFHCECEGL